MKIQIAKVLSRVSLLGAILLVASVVSAQGQSFTNKVTAKSPVDCSVGEKKLLAGATIEGRFPQSQSEREMRRNPAANESERKMIESVTIAVWQ